MDIGLAPISAVVVNVESRIRVLMLLICPVCGADMRIIAFIEDYKVIRKIPDWLGIYEFKRDRLPPKRLSVDVILQIFRNKLFFCIWSYLNKHLIFLNWQSHAGF